jgi:ketosteroid isomerase-like protein
VPVDGSNPEEEKPQDELLPNSAADEFFGRMKHDFRRPKPNPEAVASALQAIQKLAANVALDHFEESQPVEVAREKCPKCGAANSGLNRFCGYCGALLGRIPTAVTKPAEVPPLPFTTQGQDFHHHHYHHHYFQESSATNSADGQSSPRHLDEAAAGDTELTLTAASEKPAGSETAIQRLVQEWSVYFNSKRLADLVELYSADAIVLRPNSPPAHGAQAIRQLLHAAREAGLGDVELDCADIGIVGNFACLTGHSKMLVPIAAAKRHEETGKYLIVARKEGSEWKIVADSWCMDSANGQAPAQNAAVLPMRSPRANER